ncbi:MAG: glycine--tRNA ligase subunit beta [Pseudomonadota bacterium]
MPDLLLELFSEEIPARMQARAAEDLRRLTTDALVEAGLTYESAGSFVTPRRLTLSIEGLTERSPDRREERKGPRVDAPEKAIEGFLRSTGLTREALTVRDDKKGQVFFAEILTPGRTVDEILMEVVPGVIERFPWPKSMRWGTGRLSWVRPLREILCILTDEVGTRVVPASIGDLTAGNRTWGHRFMSRGAITVTSFEGYEAALARAHVILRADARADRIWHDATTRAFAEGLEVVEDPGLLAEVAGLVEWPSVLMGRIGAEFLELPAEVLQTSMREHQKFFSVRNPKTARIEGYVTVSNRETADGGATILAGNDKVLRARLADAKFFWENDLRTVATGGMAALGAPLAEVTFHSKLGSQAQRVERIAALARVIAQSVGADEERTVEAAKIAKADLASEMVYEFPELQGVMGSYYALAAGHSDAVAQVCRTHHAPLGPSDAVPTDPLAVAVALADKLDTLTGFWAIGETPTGSRDPFALRRAALGVIRILIENDLRVSLERKIAQADIGVLGDVGDNVLPNVESWKHDLLTFFADRLKVYLRGEGVRHDVIDACFRLGGQDDLVLLVRRVRALQEGLGTPDGENLVAGFKRANNILTAEEKKDGVEYSLDPQRAFAEEGVEVALFDALDAADAAIAPALDAEDFVGAMAALAALRRPIDAFFDGVTVNASSAAVRRNRLCLLNRIRVVARRIAVFDALEG